jgi:hypothetical protein
VVHYNKCISYYTEHIISEQLTSVCICISIAEEPKRNLQPWLREKHQRTNVEVLRQGSYNVTNTSLQSIDSVPNWSFVLDVLQAELVDYSDDSSDNEKDDITTKYKIVIQSGMHRVASGPRLLPYYDMVRWALDHVDIPTKTIMNEQKVTIGTFRLEHLQAMYKLPTTSDHTYGVEFLDKFKQKECV